MDLDAERALAEVLVAAGTDRLARAAHDLSTGGLAQALVDAVLRFGVGAHVDLDDVAGRDGVDLATLLFAETGARALVAVAPEHEAQMVDLCAAHGVPVARIGTTGGDALTVSGAFTLPLTELAEASAATLPRYFG